MQKTKLSKISFMQFLKQQPPVSSVAQVMTNMLDLWIHLRFSLPAIQWNFSENIRMPMYTLLQSLAKHLNFLKKIFVQEKSEIFGLVKLIAAEVKKFFLCIIGLPDSAIPA